MTEQEIKQQIDANEHQILATYNDLIRAARELGSAECHPTVKELSRAVQEASGKYTTVRILSHVIGVIFLFCMALFGSYITLEAGAGGSSVFTFLGFIGWFGIVNRLCRNNANKLDKAEAEYNSMVKIDEQVKSERSHLYSILDNAKI